MTTLTHNDIPLLRSHGFYTAFSGESWFSVDKEGTMWQAIVDEDTGDLLFHKELDQLTWNALDTMEDSRFRELFPRGMFPPRNED